MNLALVTLGVERLEPLNQNYKSENWYFSNVRKLENHLFYEKYSQKGDGFEINDFDLSQIKGTYHENYCGITWIEMLGSLKRFKQISIGNSEKINSFINNPLGIKLKKYDTDYYIIGGNHRFCIAKFLNMPISKVFVEEYVLDDTYLKISNFIKKYNFKLIEYNSSNPLKGTFSKNIDDLKFIRKYFEDLELEEVVKMINNEIVDSY
jgi:hypothetical protein